MLIEAFVAEFVSMPQFQCKCLDRTDTTMWCENFQSQNFWIRTMLGMSPLSWIKAGENSEKCQRNAYNVTTIKRTMFEMATTKLQ